MKVLPGLLVVPCLALTTTGRSDERSIEKAREVFLETATRVYS